MLVPLKSPMFFLGIFHHTPSILGTRIYGTPQNDFVSVLKFSQMLQLKATARLTKLSSGTVTWQPPS